VAEGGRTLTKDGTVKDVGADPAGDAHPEASCVENMLKLIAAL
jgi:hypothetical protein